MKTTFFKTALLAISLSMLFSCTLQKRKYMKGYTIDWNETNLHIKTEKQINKKTNDSLAESRCPENNVTNKTNISRVVPENKTQKTSAITTCTKTDRKDFLIRKNALTKSSNKKPRQSNKVSAAEQAEQYSYYDRGDSDINDFAITALVASVVGLIIWPLGIAAIAFSIIALVKNSNSLHYNRSGEVMATVALVLGILELIVCIAVITIVIAAF